jgi:hypothetical protein
LLFFPAPLLPVPVRTVQLLRKRWYPTGVIAVPTEVEAYPQYRAVASVWRVKYL